MKDKKLNAVPVCKQPEKLGLDACPDKAATSPIQGMEVDAKLVWKQFEDQVVPRLGLSLTERAVYSHLLRHSHLEGRRELHFSMDWLASGTRLCDGAARPAVRRLIDNGALRLVNKSKAGHVVEVRLPEEIDTVRCGLEEAAKAAGQTVNYEEADFFNTRELRKTIHAREGGYCFYCLRRIQAGAQGIDHVVPLAEARCHSYRNLVSACLECNSRKGDRSATDFLRELYREGRLTAAEFTSRLQALEDLAAGKLRPALPT